MSIDAFDKAMDLCDYLKTAGADVEDRVLYRMWHAVFSRVLRERGYNRKSIGHMWEELVLGNWKRLHLTDEERRRTRGEWLEDFRSEVFYCSDRWSLDRLARCHWMYRVITRGY